MLIKVREATLRFAKPKSQITLKVCERGHDFPRWSHYQPTIRDALKACACSRKLTLLASSLGVKFLQPRSRSPILIWAYARKFHLSHVTSHPICFIQIFFMIQSLGSFKALLFHLQLDVVHFMKLSPSKRKVMSSSRSTSFFCWSSVEFFYGFLGMFHVGFIHPRSLYCMVTFPLH